jgi:hypothetical protein
MFTGFIITIESSTGVESVDIAVTGGLLKAGVAAREQIVIADSIIFLIFILSP